MSDAIGPHEAERSTSPEVPAATNAGLSGVFAVQALRGHSSEAIETFLQSAAWRGERAVAIARIVIMGLALVQKSIFDLGALSQGDPKEWFAAAAALLAIGFSLPALRPPGRRSMRRRLIASVVLDALVVAAIFAPASVWPSADYHGLLGTSYLAAFLVSTAASGLRLSRSAAGVGIGVNALAILGMIALDIGLHGDQVQYDPFRTVTFGVIFCGAAAAAWATAARTRGLVVDGVNALLRAERTRQRLGAYISEELVGVALDDAELLPGGQRQSIAVLFSDLRGFTTYAERLPPERLVDELNAYLNDMVLAIHAQGGVVDKYIGDAIMAVYGVPHVRDQDAARAIRTALAMQRAMITHNAARQAKGLPHLQHGIGVHYGPAVAGNIGTPARLQYTVIGDAVNVASRLESATKELRVAVLISAEAVEAARRADPDLPPLRHIGAVAVKGREVPLEVFTFEEDHPA